MYRKIKKNIFDLLESDKLLKIDEKFFEDKKLLSFNFNPKIQNNSFSESKQSFLDKFKMGFDMKERKKASPKGSFVENNLQITHHNFNHSNNPMNISTMNINIFQKEKGELVEEGLNQDLAALVSQTKLNPNNLSKTDVFCRVNSSQLFGEEGPEQPRIKEDVKGFPGKQKGSELFALGTTSISEKLKINKNLLISKSSRNPISYADFPQK